METRLDFNEQPFIVIWETTQACDLACVHCRACAQPIRSALELSTDEAKRLIDEVAALEAPVFVLTGGDPLKRPDIVARSALGHDCGLRRLEREPEGPRRPQVFLGLASAGVETEVQEQESRC